MGSSTAWRYSLAPACATVQCQFDGLPLKHRLAAGLAGASDLHLHWLLLGCGALLMPRHYAMLSGYIWVYRCQKQVGNLQTRACLSIEVLCGGNQRVQQSLAFSSGYAC